MEFWGKLPLAWFGVVYATENSRVIRFGPFEVDLRTHELRKRGLKLKLQQQPFQVLVMLLERAGELVTREELHTKLWTQDTVVDFDHGLNAAVRRLREALNDNGGTPRFVETLPRRGYRFIAPVIVPDPGRAASQPSIAVLPFANIGADKENEYFGDGLAEEIINALAKTSGLMVAGRTSSFFFRGKDVELSEIGRRLNVQYILEGSVRRAANHVRMTAQLIGVADGFHVWSDSYDREVTDLFAIQDEITKSIAEALRIKLSPQAVRPGYRPNLGAYDAYLKAREQLLVRPSSGSGSAVLGKELLERAIQLDPEFALPYSLLGIYYTGQASWGVLPAREAIQAARAAEQQALRVDGSLPEAHAMMGCCAGMEFAWAEAEQHWSSAMLHEPVPQDVLFWYANHYLMPIGRVSEAVDVESKVLESDPLNLLYRHHLAVSLRHSRRLKEAEAELRKVLEVDSNYSLALTTLGALCAQQGRFPEGLRLTETAYAIARSALLAGQLAALLMSTGANSRAVSLIDSIKSGSAYDSSVGLVVFHALLGQFAEATDYAERAIEERYPSFLSVARPLLISTPQWAFLAKRMNLPA
ncbi:MAG TPA: winged helix-turn-helix domain-containing protein [Acidobacteriaceae bacterium]|nr:winged helix-turn-helix domain-containing protein [Acidobacteriaceae bacterium]